MIILRLIIIFSGLGYIWIGTNFYVTVGVFLLMNILKWEEVD